MNDLLFIYCTCANLTEAKTIATKCVEKRLAACANFFNSMHSIYWWEDEIIESEEVLLVFKTQKSLYSLLETEIVNHHSYQVPCIVALPIELGLESYLSWVKKETSTT